MNQREIFLAGEGDAWYGRNADAIASRNLPEDDPLLVEMLSLSSPAVGEGVSILEIGCGDASRLGWLKERRGCLCYGLDPSARAVEVATARGVEAELGTAEQLPFSNERFDIVVFGFCLYLCDTEDLFRIAYEADRVLRSPGWLLILDFYSPTPAKREYRHRSGVFARKMDYRSLFTWHPSYVNFSQKVLHHTSRGYTDDPNEWVATSVLRKNAEEW